MARWFNLPSQAGAFALVSLLAALPASPQHGLDARPPAPIRTLSLEERVRAQEQIERAYYAHQIGAGPSFEEAVPRDLLERKVHTYLRQSVALERIWGAPVRAEALRKEMDRIATGTRMPERLRELFRALGDDSFLIQETLVRATLVDRLSRSFFASDERVHGVRRSQAERIRRGLLSGGADGRVAGSRRTVVEIDAKELAQRWGGAAPPRGSVSPVREETGAFVVEAVRAAGSRTARLARYAIPKITWDAWWSEASRQLDPTEVVAVAGPAPLPLLRGPCVPDDTWDNAALGAVPTPRPLTTSVTSLHTAVWTGSVMLMFGYGGGSDAGFRYDPATDNWAALSLIDAPSPRGDHSAVWTGTEMIVWGGGLGFQQEVGTGGAYDPTRDSWRSISTLGAPAPRRSHVAVWTGGQMLVWGGLGSGSSGRGDGGRYDPATDTWTPISLVGSPPGRRVATAVWTGSEMIVWGGVAGGTPSTIFGTGGRYDPASDTWQSTSTTGAPAARIGHTAVWTGGEMIVWGGSGGIFSDLNSGGRYLPASDTWVPTSVGGAPAVRQRHTAVWTGSRMIVWGGVHLPCCDTSEPRKDGGLYDPVTDTWAPTSPSNAPSARDSHTAVWAGDRMIVWGGQRVDVTFGGPMFTPYNSGGRYDPSTDPWTPTSLGQSPPGGTGHTAVWTGTLMIDWGGVDRDTGSAINAGGRYDPVLDAWTATSVVDAPPPRDRTTPRPGADAR